ncbi:MAG: GNAT family N-acetyltransferase [Gammaproteobacteria bacterium]|nr:GNAT family N-acetyltransferase [Gammaproteobacteria bacterium]
MIKKPFFVKRVAWLKAKKTIEAIRLDVFINEQGIDEEVEWDGLDERAWHWLVLSPEKQGIGTARLLSSGQIGRMAVERKFRSQGIGSAILRDILERARELKMTSVFLHSQCHATKFYEKFNFLSDGKTFLEADIPHVKMYKRL